MNNKIIIFGYGTVSKCCISYFKSYSNYQISCITVDSENLQLIIIFRYLLLLMTN